MGTTTIYIYQLENWPNFYWRQETIQPLLDGLHKRNALLQNKVAALDTGTRSELVLQNLTIDILKSSAIEATNETLGTVLKKGDFWQKHATAPLSERQQLMLNKLLDGFEGKLTSSKWAKITKSSQDTDLRDIQDLSDKKILVKEESGGRSTSYGLVG